MSSTAIRRISFIVAAALLLAIVAMMVASLNVRPVQAGGSPQPLYTLLSAKITANTNFRIFTHTMVNGSNVFAVSSQPSSLEYYVAVLGTDFICIQSIKVKGDHPLCLPYSAISGITY